jgi:hypothetical protein
MIDRLAIHFNFLSKWALFSNAKVLPISHMFGEGIGCSEAPKSASATTTLHWLRRGCIGTLSTPPISRKPDWESRDGGAGLMQVFDGR